jgi:DNA-binding XRE family transcriptional regulator
MEKTEFSKVRLYLGKTQGQMAQLLGVSLKAIQSFEQGWRKIPTHIERQTLFLLAMKKVTPKKAKACWETQKCPVETKRNCPAWEFRAGHLCWFINGTICNGEIQESWQKKMKICRQCVVFQTMFPPLRTMTKELIS